ncbi:MAG TPA: sialidase family protein [Actinomycetota bacterium]|nr:sialidase family protein [Actinomycetota bacterium]
MRNRGSAGASPRRSLRVVPVALLAIATTLQVASSAEARPTTALEQVSADPFTNPEYDHRSEVEPDVAAHGRTAVATYQVGRGAAGGSVAIGVAVSSDDGRSWSDRILSGSAAAVGGRYGRASDPSVSYGAGGRGWLVGFLGITLTGRFDNPTRSAVLVARSGDGGSFAAPVVVARAPRGVLYDKPWVACDASRASPYVGRCYALWDELSLRHGPFGVVLASRSLDGGRHWSEPVRVAGVRGTGVMPLVGPDGSVTVVYLSTQDPFHPAIAAFTTSNGGRSWGGAATVSQVHRSARELPVRDPGFPSAAVGRDGTISVAWSDCRFEPSCAVDDIVTSSSVDGETWTAPAVAVRADPATETSLVTPGIAVDPKGQGSREAIVFYAVGGTKCSKFGRPSACSVTVGYASSRRDGWAAPVSLGWRMRPNWFPCTPAGCMWGDYIAAAFLRDGRVATMLPLATRPSRVLDVAMYAPTGGLRIGSTP